MDSDMFLKPLMQKYLCEMLHDSQGLQISNKKKTQTSMHAVMTSQYVSILSSINIVLA